MRARRLLVLVTMLGVSALWCAASASADVTQQDNVVKVTLVGGRQNADGDVFSDSLAPVFQIQVLLSGSTVQCRTTVFPDGDGPCGTQQTTGCPAVQCWTYTGTLTQTGLAIMTVDYTVAQGVPSYFQFQFRPVPAPPTTTLVGPSENDSLSPPQSFERPTFDIEGHSDGPASTQCALSVVGAPAGPWGSCSIPRLRLTGTYQLRARAVDIFGRVDATPAQAVFSPTPCQARVLGAPRSLSQFIKRGLRVSVHCVQPTKFEVDLNLPRSIVSRYLLPGANLGFVRGRTSRLLQTIALKLHALRGIPRFLSSLRTLPLELDTVPLDGYGADFVRLLSVHG